MDDDNALSFDPSFFGGAPVAPAPEQDTSTPVDAAVGDLATQATQRVAAGEDQAAVEADLMAKIGGLKKTKVEAPKEKVLSFDPSFFTTPPPAEPMGPPSDLAGPAPTQSDQAIGDMPPDFGTGGGPLDTSGFAPAMATVGHQIGEAMPRSLAAGEAGLVQFGANVLPAIAGGMGNPAAGQFLAQAAEPYAQEAASVQQQVAGERAADKAAGTSSPISRAAEAVVGGAYALPEYMGVPEAEGLGALNAVIKALPASYSAAKMKFAELQPQVGTVQALQASGLAGLINLVAGSTPLGMAGTIPERIAGGAAVGVGAEESGRVGQNAILSDRPDLQQPMEPEAIVQAGALGGAIGGVLGNRGLSPHEEAAANVQRLARAVTADNTETAADLIAQGQQLQQEISHAGEVSSIEGAVPRAGPVESGVPEGGQARGPAPPAEVVPAEGQVGVPAPEVQQPADAVAPVVPATESAAGTAPAETAARPAAPAEIVDPATLFARQEPAETFYSALNDTLESAQGAPKRGGEALKQWLDGAQRRGEIKGSERQWLGVDQWLDDHPEATRAELQDFVRGNQAQVTPVKLGVGGRHRGEEFLPLSNLEVHPSDESPGQFDVLDQNTGRVEFTGAEDEAHQHIFDQENAHNEEHGAGATKFSQYVLPGGENYREHLLTLPIDREAYTKSLVDPAVWDRMTPEQRAQFTSGKIRGDNKTTFASSHYPETPNILAHVRMNDRITADGAKALHIEEIQSDWHQKGRKEGYQLPSETTAPMDAEYRALVHKNAAARARGLEPEPADVERARQLESELTRSDRSTVPDAPLKNTEDWAMLGFKHALREAVETGKDKVTWTTGEQQAERYDLSKKINEIHYSGSNLKAYDHDGKVVISQTGIRPEELPDYIGKEAAEKLMAQEPHGTLRSLTGQELKVGGEGMRGFYDKILPKAVDKYVKQWGGKVGTDRILTHEAMGLPSENEYATVHSVAITPQMRESVREGQPLFARGEEAPKSDNLTRDQARNVLAQEWGTTALRKLEANGLRLVSRDEMTAHPATQSLTPEQRAGVTGFTPADKSSANIVHDAVTKAGLLNDTVHELVHANLDRILDPKTRNNLANAIVQRGKVNAEVAAALKKIPYSTPKANYKEEVLAQTMGDLYHQPIGHKVFDAFKLGLNRMGVPLSWINAHEAAIRQIGIDNLRHFAEAPRREHEGATYTVAPPAAGTDKKPKPRIRLSADYIPITRTEESTHVPRQEGGATGGRGVPAGDAGDRAGPVREGVAAARPPAPSAADAEPATGQPPAGRVDTAGVVQEPSQEGVTRITNEDTTQQRAKRGLGPIEKQLGNDFGDNNEAAAAKLHENPGYGEELAALLAAKPRPHTDMEVAILLRDRVRLQNEHADAMKRSEAAMDAGDETEAMAARMRARQIEEKLEVNHKASTYSGSESGRGLGARRMALNEDMSLARVLTRARVLNSGDIPADVRAKLETLTKQLAERDARIIALESQNTLGEIKSRKARTPAEKKSLDQEFTSLADQLRKLSKPQTATMFARVEDARMAAILRKMARNRSDAGETDPVKIVDAIHAEVGKDIGVSKQDVADTISNYGVNREPTKDELQIRYNAIKRELADLSRTQDTLTGKIDTATAKDRARQTALRTEIEALDRRINYRDAMAPEKTPAAYSETTQKLKDERDAKRQELHNIEPSPAPTKPADLTRAQLRKTNPERARELDAQDRLRAEIDKIDEAIAAGGTAERGKVRGPDSAEVAQLKAERAAKKRYLDKLQPSPDTVDLRDKNKIRNETYIRRLQREATDLRSRLQTGNYARPERQRTVLNKEAMQAKAEHNELVRRIDAELEKIRLNSRGRTEKIVDFGLNVRRAVILSSVKTLGKLTGAATERIGFDPVEELSGGAIGRLPGVRGIAARAPIEGGVSGHAIAQGLRHALDKEARGEAMRKLKTGLDVLDLVYGKKRDYEQSHTWLDYIGQLHGALKTPAKFSRFYSSVAKYSKWERNRVIAEGMTPEQADAHMQEPSTIAMMGAKAYENANRSIFMNDNALVSVYKGALGMAARMGAEGSTTRAFGKTGEKVGRYLLPIVRIPTNFVAEAGSYAVGLGKAAAQVGLAHRQESRRVAQQKALGQVIMHEGLKNMTPDQADYVMRNLKKQTVGAVLMFMGWNLADSIGGYYQQGDNKKKLPQKEGEITIGGVTIPKFLTHNPAMEMLHIGATMQRVYEAEARKKGETNPTTAALFAAAKGLISETPFIDTPGRLQEGFVNYKNFYKFLGNEVRGAFIPPDVQHVARIMDDDRKRKPQNFTQEIEYGIPGLRPLVPPAK